MVALGNLFWESVPQKIDILILKEFLLDFGTLFQKWLPWPNHSAHMIRIEILCRTSVSMRQEL